MEGYFSIAQISVKVNRSKQAIYKLISNNQELGKILPENTIIVGKGKQYSQAVLTWITDYYESVSISEAGSQDAEQEGADPLEMALLRQELAHIKEKLEMTEKQLEEVKAEKKEVYQQNGALLLMLAQEKQEKQQLLLEVQEQKKLMAENAEVKDITAEEVPAEEAKPAEEKKEPGFFARLFGKKSKGK